MMTPFNPAIVETLQKIEEFSVSGNLSFIDAVIEYCHRHGLELEAIGDAIKNFPRYASLAEENAKTLNLLKNNAATTIEFDEEEGLL